MNDFRDRQILLRACILAAAVFILSCTPNHFSHDKDAVPIEFASDFQVELRSSDRSGGFLKDDRIGVLAYYVPSGEEWDEYKSGAKPDFMYNVPLSYDGTSWSYSPVMYWPQKEGARLNFYTYYPYTPYAEFDENNPIPGVYVSSDETTGEPSFKFILNESADVDLMVAENEEQTAETGPVVLNFRHLLCKVQFSFSVSNEGGYSYLVNEIKVNETPLVANYDWSADEFDVVQAGSISVHICEDDGSDHLIDSTEPVLIEDFTMYLMPGNLGEVVVTINNDDPKTIDLSDVVISGGVQLNINFEVDLADMKFTTSVTKWVDGGTVSGNIS